MKRIYVWAAIVCLCALGACLSADAENCEHTWSDTYTYDANGHYRICTLCDTLSQSEAHNFSHTQTISAATCKDREKIKRYCAECKYVNPTVYDIGETTGIHNWGAYIETRAPSCERAGEQTSECQVCGEKRTLEVPMTEHVYGDFEKYNERWHAHYCKNCKAPYMRSHKLDAGQYTIQPTEASLGEIKYTCSVCGETFVRNINIDGEVFSQEGEDVLGNKVNYVRVESSSLTQNASREVKLPDGSLMEVFAEGESEIAIYANQASGKYAGLYVYGGDAVVEIVPSAATDTLTMEFVRVAEGATLTMRIFNANGEVAIDHLGGLGVVVSQKRDDEGRAHTAFTRTKLESGAISGTCVVYTSENGDVMLKGVGKNGFQLSLGDNKMMYSLSWKYTLKSKKIACNATDANGSFKGVGYYLYLNDEELMRASDIAQAAGTIKYDKSSDIWRLRVSYSDGREIRTPAYTIDGKVAKLSDNQAYSLEPIAAPTGVIPEADNTGETPPDDTQTPPPDDAQTPPPDDTQTPPPDDTQTPPPDDTQTPPDDTQTTHSDPPDDALAPTIVSMSVYDSASCVKIDGCVVEARIGEGSMRVEVSDIQSGYKLSLIRFIQKFSGDGLSLRMKMAYTDSALFSVEPRKSVVYCEVVLKDASGKEKKIKTDEYHLMPAD